MADEKKKDAPPSIDAKAMEAALNAAVARGVKAAQEEQRVRDEALARQQANLQSQSAAERKAAEMKQQRAKEDEGLDTMSRAEFGQLMFSRITDHITQHLDKAIGTMEKGLESKLAQVDRLSIKEEIKAAEGMPHFNKLKEATGEVLKERPELSVSDAYHIAAGRNKTQVAEWDTELKAEEAKKAPPLRFGGLLPTSNAGPSEPGSKMTPKDAADAAWVEASKGLDMANMFNASPVT
jgi:multidrug efflux pump subunit AcrA (membrane-fusion protein)